MEHTSVPTRSRRPIAGALLLALATVAATPAKGAELQRKPVLTRTEKAMKETGAIPVGDLPGSQFLTLTLHLTQTEEQKQALAALLTDQTTPGTPLFHKWLIPKEFGERFGASEKDLAELAAWLASERIQVVATSPSRERIEISGAAGDLQRAFGMQIRSVAIGDTQYFAIAALPTLPEPISSLVDSISGLDDLPSAGWTQIHLLNKPAAIAQPDLAVSASSPGEGSSASVDTEEELAEAVDNNQPAVLTLRSTACAHDLSSAEVREYRSILQQANAQGITVLATSGCDTQANATAGGDVKEVPSFPSGLSEVTAITLPRMIPVQPASDGVDGRPTWQAVPGLPHDGLRHEPDLSAVSASSVAQAVTSLTAETGNRLGNLNGTLYSLAKTPGLFTRVDPATQTTSPTEGAWEGANGLGIIDVNTLIKVYPRGLNSTSVSLVSSTYAINYGDTFTLTAKVLPNSYGATGPTGSVTFTASSQGVLGSATLDSSGSATLTPDVLPVGVYSVIATYTGDAAYSGASSTSKVTITISIVNAKLTATIAPATNVPYGATSTVTATVALPGSNASPSGPVSAQVEGVTGAVFTATLSPNPGGNTATANIVVSIPSPGSYTVQVTCQGNSNYQCQTPVNLPITAVKGYTHTTVSVTPAAPQAGQPISLTATVANAGNGTGSYTYNGSVTFYDSGKLLATAPVATNQATTTQTLSGNRTHNIIAIYTGDSNWSTSTSGAVAVTPTILPDSLTLSSNVSGTNSLAGANIVFTGTSTTNITYGVGPTGTITFYDTFNGSVVQLGNPATLVSNGPTASIGIFTTTGLQPGAHRIYAQYSGDDNYAAAVSPVLVLSLSDFSVTMTPTSLALAQGKSQQVTVLVGSSGGFVGPVSLGCTPPSSSLATCNFAPAAVTGGGVTTLTITTTAPTATTAKGRRAVAVLWRGLAGSSLASLLWIVLPRRRRGLPLLLTYLFTATMLSANLGCGLSLSTAGNGSGPGTDNGSSGSSSDNGTPLGTQNFIITAAGSDGVNTIRHTYPYQVTVQ